jgi:hypothetical protein
MPYIWVIGAVANFRITFLAEAHQFLDEIPYAALTWQDLRLPLHLALGKVPLQVLMFTAAADLDLRL